MIDSCSKGQNNKTRVRQEIEATDRWIDQLVYELYGLMSTPSPLRL